MPYSRGVRTLVALTVSAAALAACARGSRVEVASEADTAYRSVVSSTDLDGELVGEAPDGTEATVVIVFASWCQPCRRELAMLGELRRARPGVRVIGVNPIAYEEYEDYGDEQALRRYVASSAPWLPVVRADRDLLTALGTPRKVPTLYVFDGTGKLVRSFLREDRPPPAREELEELLAMLGR